MVKPLKKRKETDRSKGFSLFNKLPGLLNLIFRRLMYHRGLTLLALFGIILAIGLVTSASFFSEAVDRALLLQEMEAFSSVTKRPAFSTSVYTFPSSRAPVPLEQAEILGAHIENLFKEEVGLPIRHSGLQISSGGMMLRPPEGSDLYGEAQMISSAKVVYVRDIGEHIEIIEGEPLDEAGSSGDALDIWVHQRTAETMNLNVGETFGISSSISAPAIPLRVAGIWRSIDPEAEFWFNDPDSAFIDALLVRRDDYIRFVQPVVPSGSRDVSWYIILDEQAINPKRGADYIEGFDRVLQQINSFLPGARLNSPPLDPLANFVDRSTIFTVLLLAYNTPAFGILLYFLVITATIIGLWQRRETSILVSRGVNRGGLFFITFVEQVVLYVIGFPLGVGFGMLVARLMSLTTSFLSFSLRDPLPVSLHGLNFSLILLTLAFSLFSRLIPALQASRSTLVAEEREWSRPMRTPFWYRFYLDFLLLIPTWYAYDQMQKQGSLAGLIETQVEDLFNDPLLILVPALFVLSASLISMRLFSVIMRLIDVVASHTPWVALHLALRQLGRQSQDYIRPLLLVIVSLAIGVYTISMAASLDRWLVDRMSYRSGALLTFDPLPADRSEPPPDANWIPLPGDIDTVEGVAKSTRVGSYRGRVTMPDGRFTSGRIMAIDRVDFPQVAWWRKDFASESLGALMNRLALSQDAALVSRKFFEENFLRVGDRLTMIASINQSISFEAEYTIVGTYDYFPTAYEEEHGVTLVTNLDYLGNIFGIEPIYSIWIKMEPGADGETVMKNISSKLMIAASNVKNTPEIIAIEQAQLERVGVFGTLTVGFLATSVMAVMGLLVYSYASLRQRLYRFAVLNAIGLMRKQIIEQVVIEYSILTLFGTAAGSIIGIVVSRLVVPFYRYTGEVNIPLPPILPVIDMDHVILLSVIFSLVILAAEVGTIMTIFYQQLARLIKTINL